PRCRQKGAARPGPPHEREARAPDRQSLEEEQNASRPLSWPPVATMGKSGGTGKLRSRPASPLRRIGTRRIKGSHPPTSSEPDMAGTATLSADRDLKLLRRLLRAKDRMD